MVRCGTGWHVVVRCGAVWYVVLRCGTERYGEVHPALGVESILLVNAISQYFKSALPLLNSLLKICAPLHGQRCCHLSESPEFLVYEKIFDYVFSFKTTLKIGTYFVKYLGIY